MSSRRRSIWRVAQGTAKQPHGGIAFLLVTFLWRRKEKSLGPHQQIRRKRKNLLKAETDTTQAIRSLEVLHAVTKPLMINHTAGTYLRQTFSVFHQHSKTVIQPFDGTLLLLSVILAASV